MIEDRPQMPVGGDVASLKVRNVGICGTDRKIVAGSIPVGYPRVIGHEIGGVVEVTPPGSNLSEGDRVLVDPGMTCGVCPQCRAGRPNICTGGWLIGRDRDGGMTQSMEVPVENLYPVPPSIADEAIPVLQVLATCMHAHRELPLFPGDPVVVLGLGVTGLLHLQIARLRGASPVIGVSRSAEKLALATRLGADLVAPADGTEIDVVLEATDGGAALVIECVGSAATLGTAVRMLRVGGRVCCYGTITGGSTEFPWYDLYFKEVTLTNPRSADPMDFPAAIDAVAGGRIEVDPIVTHRFPLSDVMGAIAMAGDPTSLKVVVDV